MSIKSIMRVFVNGVALKLMPEVQEEARKLGLPQSAVTLDNKRGETKVNCKVDVGRIIPEVPGFMPQFINYGLPAKKGTAVIVIDVRKEGKAETKVFIPRKCGEKTYLFFRNGVVFNLWDRSLEVFYLGAERKEEENGEKYWKPVFKPMLDRSLPPFVVTDQQMREYLLGELKGKVLDSHLVAVNELTLNPVLEKRVEKSNSHRDEQPNNGINIGSKDKLPGVVVATADPPPDNDSAEESASDNPADKGEMLSKEEKDRIADAERNLLKGKGDGSGKKGDGKEKKEQGSNKEYKLKKRKDQSQEA